MTSAATKKTDSDSTLSQISVTKFPKFLESIEDGMSIKKLHHSKYETEGNDYTKLGKVLNFITIRNSEVFLTSDGMSFLQSLGKRSSKSKLDKQLRQNIPEYVTLLQILSKEPQNFDTIVQNLNRTNDPAMSETYIMLLLGPSYMV